MRRDAGHVLSTASTAQTAAAIAAAQLPDGAIPWEPGGKVDPWDHTEAAMGLDAAGRHREAAAAYRWLAGVQRADGSWPSEWRAGRVVADHAELSFCAYLAVGVWHHALATGDEGLLRRLWPTVRRGLDFVVGHQRPGGEVPWSVDRRGRIWHAALLTGCASILQSLRCGLAIADRVGAAEPDWELAVGPLAHAVARHPERFEDKTRYSMDWYYPVLAGAVRGLPAEQRIAGAWHDFVVEGVGIRCVIDRPWVTGAETCELALALSAMGRRDDAAAQIAAMQHLRADDGSYWTGLVFDEGVRWPVERTTWTAAAVLLADDALDPASATAQVFHGTRLPVGVGLDGTCADEAACRVA